MDESKSCPGSAPSKLLYPYKGIHDSMKYTNVSIVSENLEKWAKSTILIQKWLIYVAIRWIYFLWVILSF